MSILEKAIQYCFTRKHYSELKINFRVKVCAQLNEHDLKLAHKLLIQVYYYYLCRDQPLLFREPTNPSFMSSLSDAFATVADNVRYLKSLVSCTLLHLS